MKECHKDQRIVSLINLQSKTLAFSQEARITMKMYTLFSSNKNLNRCPSELWVYQQKLNGFFGKIGMWIINTVIYQISILSPPKSNWLTFPCKAYFKFTAVPNGRRFHRPQNTSKHCWIYEKLLLRRMCYGEPLPCSLSAPCAAAATMVAEKRT